MFAAARAEGQAQIMPVSEVKAGMRGYGVTTLKEPQAGRFDVEVLGVLKVWGPSSAILVRLSGKLLEETGLVAGMSGSPVYVDGRLLGAVAFGWYWAKVPIAGVTPAEEMMVVERLDREPGPGGRVARKSYCRSALQRRSRKLAELVASPAGQELTGEAVGRRLLELIAQPFGAGEGRRVSLEFLPDDVRSALPVPAQSALMPLPVPLAVGGIDGAHREPLFSLLSEKGFFPVQAGGAAAAGLPGPELAPGAPVGLVFVKGDMDISAMGTVTSVVGDRVLAFGHSMLGSGQIDVPMALGTVHTVVPSLRTSFRVSSAAKIIGRFTQDREAAVVGRLGESAGMFPCKVNVRGAAEESYSYEVSDYWEVCPLMTFAAISASVARWEGMGNPYTISAQAEIRLAGHADPIVLRNTYTSFSPDLPAARLVGIPLEALMLNPFKEVKVEGVTFQIEIREGFESALIESLAVSRRELAPGERLRIYVKLKEFRGAEVVKKLDLEIPEDARPGTRAEIMVCDAPRSFALRLGQDPSFFAPRDFQKLLDALKFMEQNTSIFVHGSFLRRGVRYEGEAMPDLPESFLNMLQFSREAGKVAPLVRDVKLEIKTPWAVEGSQTISVLITEPQRGAGEPY